MARTLTLNGVARTDQRVGTLRLHEDDTRDLDRFLPGTKVWAYDPRRPQHRIALGVEIDRGSRMQGGGAAVFSSDDLQRLGLQSESPVQIQSARPFQPSIVAVIRIDEPGRRRPPRTGPERLVILFDNSGSMAGTALDEAKRALRTLIFEKIRNPIRDERGLVDEVGLIRFGEDTEVVFQPDSAYESHLDQIFALEAGGGTPMEEALKLVPALFDGWDGPHRRVLMITDGGAHVSEDCIQELVEQAIEVISVSIGGQGTPVLEAIAGATGGRVVPVENLSELDSVLFSLA